MSIGPGTRLGPYEVTSRIGGGGMGEVWRASDTRLGRDVALKVLSADLASAPQAIARFGLEARAASALNHPHIVHVYEVDAVTLDGERLDYIAMELIEGETLRKRIASGAGLGDLLAPLIQCADALARAHAAGIVHRDLKPENIMITADGYAKLLDFGLAKRMPSFGQSVTSALTASGMMVGTVGYMAPEQIDGRMTDARADVFSFGCVLYEVAAGRRAFSGPSAVDVLHQIVHADPPPLASPRLQSVVQRCLAKNPEDRYPSMRELAQELRALQLPSQVDPEAATAVLPRRRGRRAAAAAAGLVALAAVAALVVRIGDSVPASEPFRDIRIEKATFTGNVTSAAISPTGRYLAFVREDRKDEVLVLAQIATGSEVELARGAGFRDLRFSPDEQYVYFGRVVRYPSVDLYRIAVLGGAVTKLASKIDGPISFSPSGDRIAFIRRSERESRIVTAALDAADERVVFTTSERLHFPLWSPSDDAILCMREGQGGGPANDLVSVDLATRSLRPVRQSFGVSVWMPDGKGVIVPRVFPEPVQQIRYIPIPSGPERRITADLASYTSVTVTADGRTIAAVQTERTSSIWLLPRGDPAAARPLTAENSGRDDGLGMAWARDGALFYKSADRAVHLVRLEPDRSPRFLYSEPYASLHLLSGPPSVSPDGKRVAFASPQADQVLWIMNADGGERRALVRGFYCADPQWTPDGRWIVYGSYQRSGHQMIDRGLWKVPAGGGVPVRISGLAATAGLSRDGRWILQKVHSGDTTRLQLQPIDGAPPRVLPFGGEDLIGRSRRVGWSPDGRSVEYLTADHVLMRQPVEGGRPVEVARLPDDVGQWAWSHDGEMLAITRSRSKSDVVLVHDSARERVRN